MGLFSLLVNIKYVSSFFLSDSLGVTQQQGGQRRETGGRKDHMTLRLRVTTLNTGEYKYKCLPSAHKWGSTSLNTDVEEEE